MRVSTSMIYDSVIRYTAKALENYYELSEQNSSMKKINSASDDPAGYSAILALRDHMSLLEQYQENCGTAEGWLGSADSALQEASSLIISIMELAEQGATETLTADEREILAEVVREYLGTMVTLANTEYNGNSIFAGQDTDGTAYNLALYADVHDDTLDQDSVLSVDGEADHSIVVQFLDSGTIGGAADLDYQYSTDGGETWTTATLSAGDTSLNLDTCIVEMAPGATVTEEIGDGGGTSLVIRPTALYTGDADDGAAVTAYANSVVTAAANGLFDESVVVRIDSDGSVASGAGVVTYSYSTDGGNTWVEGNSSEDGIFKVDGGYLTLSSNAGADVYAGDQYVITSDKSEIMLDLSESSSVDISTVGLDAFGGLYQASGETDASAVDGANLFETIGRLIGGLETNDTDVIAQCLEELDDAQQALLVVESDVGSRENKVTSVDTLLELRYSADETLLSSIEDVDVTELMVDLESASTIYQSVVETSTAIMRLSLINYI